MEKEDGGLKLSLMLDKPRRVGAKEPITVTLTVTNVSQQPFRDSSATSQAYNFLVTKGNQANGTEKAYSQAKDRRPTKLATRNSMGFHPPTTGSIIVSLE